MHLAVSPEKFVDAWHLRATDGFDFAFPDKRIEVKATERPSREHDFSLKQVRSGRETDFVASITLARSSAGLSALDLGRLIAERLDAAQQANHRGQTSLRIDDAEATASGGIAPE